jgi:hypothetical protein
MSRYRIRQLPLAKKRTFGSQEKELEQCPQEMETAKLEDRLPASRSQSYFLKAKKLPMAKS